MKHLLIIFLFLYGVSASAQDCNPEMLRTLPGIWLPQKQDDIVGSPNKPTAADVSAAKKNLVTVYNDGRSC